MVRRPTDLAASGVVITAAVVLAVTTSRPVMPAFLPIGDYAAYGAADAPARVALEPLLHAPWFGALSSPVAAAVTVAVLVALWLAASRLGATTWAAAATALAFAARPEIGTPLALGAPPLMAMALTWLAVIALGDVRRRPAAGALVSAAALALACALWPPTVVLVPAALAVVATALSAPSVVGVLVAAIAGTLGGMWILAARATAMWGTPLALGDVWTAAVAPVLATSSPFPWPPLAVAQWPIALATAGAVVRLAGAPRRVAVVVMAIATAVVVWRLPAWRPDLLRAWYWSAWPLVAVGLTWLTARAREVRRPLVLVVLSAVLVGSGLLARLRQTELVEPEAFATALAAALEPGDGATATVVAEDPRVDTALVAWAGSRLRRLPVSVDAVTAVAPPRIVLAGPMGRAALELWGMRFAAGPTVTTPVPFGFARVDGALPCVSVTSAWTDLTTLPPTGRWGVHVPAGDGRLELVIDGATSSITRVATVDGRSIGTVATMAPAAVDGGPPPVLAPDAASLQRLTILARADVAIDEAVVLNSRAPRAAARMMGGAEARICAAP